MYEKYQDARNASWRLLIDFKITELPVKISTILKKLNINLHSYENGDALIKHLNLIDKTKNCDGFAVNIKNKYYIFYNQNCSIQRCRFTLAHELGHILLNHVKPNSWSTANNAPSQMDTHEETQANIFASRLLAPACVLHELKATTLKQIMVLCQISKKSAQFRLERLKLLEKRNINFLVNRGYGCFYLNPLEKQVYHQFKDYIDNTIL